MKGSWSRSRPQTRRIGITEKKALLGDDTQLRTCSELKKTRTQGMRTRGGGAWKGGNRGSVGEAMWNHMSKTMFSME